MRPTLLSATLAATALLAVSHPLAAQGYVEVGGFDSYARFDRTLPWNQANSGGARLSLGSGAGLAAFVLEGEGAYFSLGGSSGTLATQYVPSRARLLYTPTVGKLALMMGGGAVRNDFFAKVPTSTHSVAYGYTALAGFRVGLGSYMALRAEGVLDYLTHPVNAAGGVKRNTNRSVQAGLSFPLWASRPVPRETPAAAPAPAPMPAAQPQQPAPAPSASEPSRLDLPDADRDGVPDARDACSGTAAASTVDGEGCAVYRDTDGDGVIDPRDACPATPAGEVVDGRGCTAGRDADDDGVADTRDRCAGTPAGTPVNSIGCEVKAPAAAAAPAPAPAPAALFAGPARTVTLRGVNFAPWKEELTPGSLRVLDDVARQLVEAPSVRVEIAGHTDARGAYARNLRLSLIRAEAVRAYLIMRGVDGDRLVARGYGMTKPITENTTAAGRAMNRRVELRRLD